ncbi:hypothetical protein N7499_007520 [Penicillium canescens]|nr:hypothetical protein N7499_007520 [Penicillium canescens]
MSMSNTSTTMFRRALLSSRLATSECTARTIRPAFAAYRNVSSSARLPTLTASETRRRPTVRPNQQPISQNPLNGLSPTSKRTIFIQTENTPNPDVSPEIYPQPPRSPRRLPNHIPRIPFTTLNPRATPPSPLAAKLLDVEGVTSVFYGADFITVTKAGDANWAHIKPEVFSIITQAVTSGETIVTTVEAGADGEESVEDSLSYNEDDDEVVGMIKELLETRIRPAIQEDGGDIELRGFEDGIVMLKLRGACRTCDSSTVTLKNGIESMLMHYIEEVKGVEQVMDEEEVVSMHEFARFEEKLRQQKGAAATASAPLDSAP